MGDLDKTLWPVDDDRGGRKDPWSPDARAELYTIEVDGFSAGELFTFYSSAWGGKIAFQDLFHAYDRACDDHPGEMPIVKIGTYKRVSKKYGKIDTPSFEVVGWAPVATAALGQVGRAPKKDVPDSNAGVLPGSQAARATLAEAKAKFKKTA
jgi:hypothetical protein